jgi:hypothetical protein
MDAQKPRIESKTKAARNKIAGGFFFSAAALRLVPTPRSEIPGHFDVAIGPVSDNAVVRKTGGQIDLNLPEL